MYVLFVRAILLGGSANTGTSEDDCQITISLSKFIGSKNSYSINPEISLSILIKPDIVSVTVLVCQQVTQTQSDQMLAAAVRMS